MKDFLIKKEITSLVKYDPDDEKRQRVMRVATENKANKAKAIQAEYNQAVAAFEQNNPKLVSEERRLSKVDPNDDSDDGWRELRDAQILARKKIFKDVLLLDSIIEDPSTSKREKIRATEHRFNVATEKVGPNEKGDTYNINTLIQILTGNLENK